MKCEWGKKEWCAHSHYKAKANEQKEEEEEDFRQKLQERIIANLLVNRVPALLRATPQRRVGVYAVTFLASKLHLLH